METLSIRLNVNQKGISGSGVYLCSRVSPKHELSHALRLFTMWVKIKKQAEYVASVDFHSTVNTSNCLF